MWCLAHNLEHGKHSTNISHYPFHPHFYLLHLWTLLSANSVQHRARWYLGFCFLCREFLCWFWSVSSQIMQLLLIVVCAVFSVTLPFFFRIFHFCFQNGTACLLEYNITYFCFFFGSINIWVLTLRSVFLDSWQTSPDSARKRKGLLLTTFVSEKGRQRTRWGEAFPGGQGPCGKWKISPGLFGGLQQSAYPWMEKKELRTPPHMFIFTYLWILYMLLY